ncbi:fanconi-associated nuclease 1 [Kwoniella heveanensis CBS 569]|nr:fanconi-associated nuclease 1 [Kwoniella heveanensis CBS 569]
MNSSPPPPSFTLPPLSSGNFPLTPSPTPSPGDENASFKLKANSPVKPSPRKGKDKEEAHVTEEEGRISMYVKLFDDEPHYLLTRLLLRRPCKIHPYSSLVTAYSAELGDEGVKRAMKTLSRPLDVPQDIVEAEPIIELPSPSKPPVTPLAPTKSYPTPLSAKAKGKQRSTSNKPWASLASGLTPDEEKADPDLAEALKESLWAAKVGRVELDEDGVMVDSPTPEPPSRARSVSGGSSTSVSSRSTIGSAPLYVEEFSLTPKPPPSITLLARNEGNLLLEDIMSCISADDLRKVAKLKKVPPSALMNREAITTALKGLAKKQTVLNFTPVKGKGKATVDANGKAKQSTLPFSFGPPKVTSESLLIDQLLPYLGHSAIQLSAEIHALIARVNLIFSRTPPLTSGGASLMLPSILVTSHKRRYPDYGPPTRSKIWKDRDELLIWERAVSWEATVSDALGETWAEQRKNPLPGMGMRKEMLGRVDGAKVVKKIWEGVWEVWKELVEGDRGQAVDSAKEDGGLVGDRFRTGHVLTRIVYKGATALGILHEYDAECMVLQALLKQRRWRRSKRGAWYDRLALVLMNHYNDSPEQKEEKLREAVQVCIDALLDEDTHLIYRPALSRRLTRLENKLNLPADERHISYASLNKCETRELTAPRVAENMGQPKILARARSESVRADREASLGMGDEEARAGGIQQTGKSVWLGKEGEVTVEGWVLEWWEKKGYKGFHSESSILTTLFSLMMWPILFSPLPGAFETPYQTAPLDLGEDTFAPSRQEAIEVRLEAMSRTSTALSMLKEVDDRERPRGTWAVGVNWDYGATDLEEILECLGGRAVAGVCRMLAEEYRHRCSGVPDLIVWDYANKDVRFVEVKGPGDSLSETQKVWIDVLLSSGIQVEVCKVKAKEPTTTQIEKAKKRKSTTENLKTDGQPKRPKKEKKVYERGDDGEYIDADELEAVTVRKDEEDEGWEKEDEFRLEDGEEGKGEGKWEKRR